MAFIDNSKDIIIDAVLTDLGRQRLAQGRFNVARFGLGDDEINYALFDSKAPSAVQDLEILKTPVFEAFTNNISTMNSRLVSYTDNTLWYLPVIKLNTKGLDVSSLVDGPDTSIQGGTKLYSDNSIGSVFLVAINQETVTSLGNLTFIDGSKKDHKNYIRLDQGIDSSDNIVSKEKDLDQELLEEQYTLEIDNRFGFLTFENMKLQPTFIDDDDIALYTFNYTDNSKFITKLLAYDSTVNNLTTSHVLSGMRGTSLRFGIYSSTELQIEDSELFNIYGVPVTIGTTQYNVIHTTATVTGLKTGYSIDIPISFIKKI